jgi:hypothetical protein
MIRRAALAALLVGLYLLVRLLWMPAPGGTSEQVSYATAQPALDAALATLDAAARRPAQTVPPPGAGISSAALPELGAASTGPSSDSPSPPGLVAFPVAASTEAPRVPPHPGGASQAARAPSPVMTRGSPGLPTTSPPVPNPGPEGPARGSRLS